jgi:hypothetical protein
MLKKVVRTMRKFGTMKISQAMKRFGNEEDEGGVAGGQIGAEEGGGTEEGNDIGEQFAVEKIDGAVDGETWFLHTFSSIRHYTESLWFPPVM